jgi:hypothetical protein
MNSKITSMLAILCCLTITQFSFTLDTNKSIQATIDTTGIDVQDFGIINKLTIKKISIPISGKMIFSITPTVGKYTGTPIKALLYALDVTQSQAKTVVGVFRQVGEESGWTFSNLIFTIDTPTELAADESIKLILTGDGKVVATLPAFQKALNDGGATKVGATRLIVELGKG